MTATTWTGRPDLSDIENFWTAPIAERAAAFAALREREPVPFFAEPQFSILPAGPGYWALTRLDDLVHASRNAAIFTSGSGSTSIADMPARVPRVLRLDDQHGRPPARPAAADRLPRLHPEAARRPHRGGRATARTIVDDVIDAGRVRRRRRDLGTAAAEDRLRHDGRAESQYEFVFDRSNIILGASDPEYVPDAENILMALMQAGNDLAELMRDLGRHRAANPTDDVTSALVNAEIDGERLTPDELAAFFILLVVAGNETTRNAVSWGSTCSPRTPASAPRGSPTSTASPPTAVEEIVRLASPVIFMRRTLATDAVLGGQPMSEGDKVLLFYWAANRDPAHFDDPDAFDVRRSPNPHVGFGGAGPALLPRRAPGPPGDGGDVPRAAHPPPRHPLRRRAAAAAVELHQRDQAHAGGVHSRRWRRRSPHRDRRRSLNDLTLDYPEVPVGALLAGSARRFGDRTALHFAERELGFAELYERACAFAHALGDAGIGRGDVVAIHLPNCPQYAIAYYGILLSGAAFSPTNPLLPPADLAAQLADCGAVAAVTWVPAERSAGGASIGAERSAGGASIGAERSAGGASIGAERSAGGASIGAAPALAAVLDRTAIRLVLVTDRQQAVDPSHRTATDAVPGAVDFEAFHAEAPTTDPAVAIDVHHDLAHLAYTGGTTGRSKGVQLPHRNVVVNSLQYACWGTGSVPALDDGRRRRARPAGLGAEEFPTRLGTGVAINLTPWFHAMGTVGSLNVPLLTGSTTVLHERFDPGAYLADAERFAVTSMAGAPPLFGAMLRHPDFLTRDLSTIRGIIRRRRAAARGDDPGAAPRFGEDVVIAEGYGLTEVTMGATLGPGGRSAVRKVGTVGVPVYDTEVRILDLDGTELPAGQAARCASGARR